MEGEQERPQVALQENQNSENSNRSEISPQLQEEGESSQGRGTSNGFSGTASSNTLHDPTASDTQ